MIVGDLPGQIIKGAPENDNIFSSILTFDYQRIKSHINQKTVNKVDPSGQSPLYVAVSSIQPELVDLLLNSKADPNLGIDTPSFSSTPLHCAAMNGSLQIAKTLISKGADVNRKDSRKKTPLHLAVEWKKDEIVQFLLGNGADPCATDLNGRNSLHIASMAGRRMAILLLLEFRSIHIDSRDANQQTPLHLAVLWNRHLIVPILASQGKADINAADNQGNTALHIAARYNKQRMIEILLEFQPDLKVVNKEGMNAMQYASSHGQMAAAQLLMLFGQSDATPANRVLVQEMDEKRKADNAKQDEIKQMKLKKDLVQAAKLGDTFTIQRCLEVGVSPESKANALIIATRNGHTEVMGMLTEADDFDVSKCVDQKGSPLLHLAVYSGISEALSELLVADVIPVDVLDLQGYTALCLACEVGNLAMVKDLISAGAS